MPKIKETRLIQSLFERIPADVVKLFSVLEHGDKSAWLVGGCVRDLLMGRPPHDFDMCSSEIWQENARILRAAGYKVFETGTKHGTITVCAGNYLVELTTFRVDGDYSDGRHPDQVHFTRSIEEDLARRDFTMNALALHPTRGLLDLYGGQSDIASKIIRAVGNPYKRMHEDYLRILRAMRFSSELGFSLEDKTRSAVFELMDNLADIAYERIGQELTHVMKKNKLSSFMRLWAHELSVVIPEIDAMAACDQKSVYHAYDVLEHTIRVCIGCEAISAGAASQALLWAALFHDIAKPATYSEDIAGHGHFFKHPEESVKLARYYMKRFAIGKDVRLRAETIILEHDVSVSATYDSILKMLVRIARRHNSKEAYAIAHEVIVIKKADALAKASQCRDYIFELAQHEKIIREIKSLGIPLVISDLAIGGHELMELGYTGPAIGMMLEWLLICVQEGSVANTAEELLEYLQ